MENEDIKLSDLGEKAKELLSTLEAPSSDSSIIQDNKIIFLVDNVVYRCNMPTQKQRTLAEDKRNRLYGELLDNGGYKTRKQLKALLKDKQGIDIDFLEAEKEGIQENLKNTFYLSLATKSSDDTITIDTIKSKITDLRVKHVQLCYEISNYLAPSIEDRLEKEYIEYITYLCTEIADEKEADKWNTLWSNFDEFQNSNSKVTTKAIQYMVTLLLNTRE